jgi:hypothetical protein
MSAQLAILIKKHIILGMIWLLVVPARVLVVATACCAGRSAAGRVSLVLVSFR